MRKVRFHSVCQSIRQFVYTTTTTTQFCIYVCLCVSLCCQIHNCRAKTAMQTNTFAYAIIFFAIDICARCMLAATGMPRTHTHNNSSTQWQQSFHGSASATHVQKNVCVCVCVLQSRYWMSNGTQTDDYEVGNQV